MTETIEWCADIGADVNGMRDLVAESGPYPDRDTAHDAAVRLLGKTVGEISTLSNVSLCPVDKDTDPDPAWRVAGVSIMEVSSEYGALHDTIEDFDAAPMDAEV